MHASTGATRILFAKEKITVPFERKKNSLSRYPQLAIKVSRQRTVLKVRLSAPTCVSSPSSSFSPSRLSSSSTSNFAMSCSRGVGRSSPVSPDSGICDGGGGPPAKGSEERAADSLRGETRLCLPHQRGGRRKSLMLLCFTQLQTPLELEVSSHAFFFQRKFEFE